MSLPINQTQTKQAATWLKQHFGQQINNAVAGTLYSPELVIAIACQETAYKWLNWIGKHDPATIVARCVFDTSGEPEFPQAPRSCFPKDRNQFKAHYGHELLSMLVTESNKTRQLQGWGNAPFLAKAYGLWQFDLQNIVTDKAFFAEKQWYNIDICLQKLIGELNEKAKLKGNLKDIVRRYNGAGIRAESYANNVMQFAEWV